MNIDRYRGCLLGLAAGSFMGFLAQPGLCPWRSAGSQPG